MAEKEVVKKWLALLLVLVTLSLVVNLFSLKVLYSIRDSGILEGELGEFGLGNITNKFAEIMYSNPPIKQCISNKDCTKSQFCKSETGNCGGVGTCVAKPEFCAQFIDPVCGCDGMTYNNECLANSNGVSIQKAGECEVKCTSNKDCTKSQFCKFKTGECGGVGVCVEIPQACPLIINPVCGCNKKTYDSECFAGMNKISVKNTGSC